jgi:hypothetical protein
MELAGLEPATSWVRFGRARRSNHGDLQVFWLSTREASPPGIPTDCRRSPGVCPPNGVSGAKALAGVSRLSSSPPDLTSWQGSPQRRRCCSSTWLSGKGGAVRRGSGALGRGDELRWRRVPRCPLLDQERLPRPSPWTNRLGTPPGRDRMTTLAQASLTLQTARSHPPRFAPGLSTARGGFATRDLGISPDRTHAGRPPRTCRSLRHVGFPSPMAPSSLGAPVRYRSGRGACRLARVHGGRSTLARPGGKRSQRARPAGV